MTETVTITRTELDSLRERLRTLAREKSNLQLAADMMNRLSMATGHENVVENILCLVQESVGGGELTLYYPVGDEFWVADVRGDRRQISDIDDPLVRQALESRALQLGESEHRPDGMTAPDLPEHTIWAQPLLVGQELVGILRFEGVMFGVGEPLARLAPFFSYAAQIIKNEMATYSVLREAFDELRTANEGLVHEMVERRRVEESLRLTQFSVDRASEIILWIDAEGGFLYANDMAERLIGYTRIELLEITIGSVAPVFPDDIWPLYWHKFRKQGAVTLESRFRTRDGSEFPVELTVNYLELEGNEYVIASARDISRRKQAERQLAQAYEQARTELRAAAEMQKHILPPPSAICGIDFAWRYIPCRYVAGDIFNYFRLDETRLAFYLLDVAGHGVSAAMLSFSLSTILSPRNGQLKRLVPHPPGYEILAPAEMMALLNQQFQSGPDVASYFTMTYGIIDLSAHHLTLVQAGTPHPILISRSGEISRIGDGGPPVGLLDGMSYEDIRVPFGPGDRLIICSDGVTECAGRDGVFFPHDLLVELLHEGIEQPLPDALGLVGDELRRWRGREEFDDDITILALERV